MGAKLTPLSLENNDKGANLLKKSIIIDLHQPT
jgi:hypothetical protein